MKIGILRETKKKDDQRVAFTPVHARNLIDQFPSLQIVAQPSETRIFSNSEYLEMGIELNEDLSDCDLLLGVKEVDIKNVIPGKKYLFFAHVAKQQDKKQLYLKKLASKDITLIDYEYLKDEHKNRIVSFGFWAGIAGCHYAIHALLKKIGMAENFSDTTSDSNFEFDNQLKRNYQLPPVKFMITGSGETSNGVVHILQKSGVKNVAPEDFHLTFQGPVFTILKRQHHIVRHDGQAYSKKEYQRHPELYYSILNQFAAHADVYLACHYWEPKFPKFLVPDDLIKNEFNIKIIADISCEIDGPIASTIRESTHHNPYYDYDPINKCEALPFSSNSNITVMAIGNLPSAFPRKASTHFSELLSHHVLPSFIKNVNNEMIEKATILKKGKLTSHFSYLYNYLNQSK